jgi:hypothetical protein
MKYTIEMDSGVMIFLQSLIKTGSGIKKFMGEEKQTSLLLIFSK